MGRTVKIIRVGDLGKTFTKACATQSSHTANAIHSAAKTAATNARVNAPVYNPAKWEGTIYANFAHHHTPVGTLKRSIRTSRMIHTEDRFETGIKAYARFASDIELGFKHHITRRKIRGKRFMFRSVNVVFKRAVDRRLDEAVAKIFGVR